MTVYRLAAKEYINDLSGTGARLYGGRWNPVGSPGIYTSEHISLALVEKYVHAKSKENMERIALVRIEIDENKVPVFHAEEKLLKKMWYEDILYSQWIGEQILSDLSIAAFSVPSAIIPTERNIILNPAAEKFHLIKFSEPADFITDFRLLSKLLH